MTAEHRKRTNELCRTISEAVDSDEQGDGCDISAGLFGLALSNVIRDLAQAQLEGEKYKQLLSEFDAFSQTNIDYMGSPFEQRVADALAENEVVEEQ